MAKVSGNAVQLGDSATASQNFVLQTMLDGTAKLSRGNLGSTTQDVLTVDAAGKVTLTNGEVVTASKLQSGTAVASTSGTSIDFTGIPSWAKRITVMFNGVSTNGSSIPQIQLGDSGGIENTGYTGNGSLISDTANSPITTSSSTGFILNGTGAATYIMSGRLELTLLNSNTWVLSSCMGLDSLSVVILGGGSKTLSSSLDRIRITTVNGTDTFDAGSINIMWE